MDNRIIQIIRQKNITQMYLAGIIGITPAYLNRIIKKKVTPTVPLGMRIADALGVSVEELFILNQ